MAHPNKLRIVIADDHPIFRDGLRTMIESERGFKVVGEAGDGESALEMIQKLGPAIAVLDIAMPKMDGLMLARQLLEVKIPVAVILVTMYREQKLYSSGT